MSKRKWSNSGRFEEIMLCVSMLFIMAGIMLLFWGFYTLPDAIDFDGSSTTSTIIDILPRNDSHAGEWGAGDRDENEAVLSNGKTISSYGYDKVGDEVTVYHETIDHVVFAIVAGFLLTAGGGAIILFTQYDVSSIKEKWKKKRKKKENRINE